MTRSHCRCPGGGGGRHPTVARSEEDFLVPGLGSPIRFLKDASGKVTHLRLMIVEGNIDAVRLARP